MKKIIISVGMALALMLCGCDNRGHSDLDYRVNVTLDNKQHHDSATLLVLEEEYNQLRVCGTALAKDGTFTFTGQTNKPKAALIRWDNDSVEPFYFVLEGGDINVTISSGAWNITGSPQNSVHSKIHVSYSVANEDDLHELTGIGQRDVTGAEEAKYRVEQNPADHHEQQSDDQVQRDSVAQQMLGGLVVALAQLHTDTRRGTDADSCSEGCTQVHEGKGNAKSSNGVRTHHLTNESTINDVVQG